MAKPAIFCICGKKKSGKTTFLEKLIPELRRRGFRVGVIKHDRHGFDLDTPGKDTWRHRQAGATGTLISSPDKVGMVLDVTPELELRQLADRFFHEMDLVLTEGYAGSDQPKLELFRPETHDSLILTPADGLLAVISDHDILPGVLRFGLDDAASVADFLESTLKKG